MDAARITDHPGRIEARATVHFQAKAVGRSLRRVSVSFEPAHAEIPPQGTELTT